MTYTPVPSSPLLVGLDDTIAAIATPPGRSALAVIRISGISALQIGERCLVPWRESPRVPFLAALRHPVTQQLIDRVVATSYVSPRSYTGEQMLELSLHGGTLVPALALDAVLAAGARQALPGEFTRRAVLHGKMDLLEGEAVGDLIDSRSHAAHRLAISQLEGGLSRRITVLRNAILNLESLIAYDIDFPEEDDGPIAPGQILEAARAVSLSLETLLATSRVGELIRHGAQVVIAGAPNAGKSALFNALVGSARALVTEIAGTTRDAIEAEIEVRGWPIRLVDTAGLRESRDVLERLGIEISERHIASAELVMLCGESRVQLREGVQRVQALTTAPILAVRTKADLDRAPTKCEISAGFEPDLAISVYTGFGLSELADALFSKVSGGRSQSSLDAPLLTREHQERAVWKAASEMREFSDAWISQTVPITVAAVHLRTATSALDQLIAPIDTEEVLDQVFRTFCVGK